MLKLVDLPEATQFFFPPPKPSFFFFSYLIIYWHGEEEKESLELTLRSLGHFFF